MEAVPSAAEDAHRPPMPGSRLGSVRPERAVQSGSPWHPDHLQVKNTFLHLSPASVEGPEGFHVLRRKASAPDLSRCGSPDAGRSCCAAAVRAGHLVGEPDSFPKGAHGRDSVLDDSARKRTLSRDSLALTTAACSQHEGSDKEDSRYGSKPSVSTQLTDATLQPAAEAGEASAGDEEEDGAEAEAAATTGGARKKSMRPCKGKRDRYRKAYERFRALVVEGLDPERLELPAWLDSNAELRAKMLARLRRVAEEPARSLALDQGNPPYRSQHSLRQQPAHLTQRRGPLYSGAA